MLQRPELEKSALARLLGLLLAVAAVLSQPSLGLAGQFGSGSDQHARARLYHRAKGDLLQLVVDVQIDKGWHLYNVELGPEDAVGLPLTIEFEGPGLSFSSPRLPEPERLEQPVGQKGKPTWIWGFEGRLRFYALGQVEPGSADLDPEDLRVLLTGLTCEDSGSCVPFSADQGSRGPGEDSLFADFPGDLTVASIGAGSTGGTEVPGTEASGAPSAGTPAAARSVEGGERSDEYYAGFQFENLKSRQDTEQRGLGWFLLLAFVAGMILNVMPCVLPVISIKVLSFVQQAGEDKRRVFHLGLAFSAGIVMVFWVLAGVAISVGLSWGEQFQSPSFLIAMIGVVFAFALSMFGVYELGVPSQLGELAGARREGLGDAFFKGMLATALATPCSGPFLGSTLTWTLSQPPTSVLLIFTALGFGMALPYVLLTANPKLLKKLPKPGAWMDTFKQAMGFVLLATVLYLMISLETGLLLYTIAFLLFVGFACWWYGHNATFDKSKGVRLAHLGVALAIVAGGARVSFVDFRGLYEGESSSEWVRFEPDAMQTALDSGHSVFVDFTAKWCPNCKFNKVTVFDTEAVVAAMRQKGVVRFEADMTHNTAYTRMLERLRDQLGSRSIPFMAIFPADRPEEAVVARDIVTKQQLLEMVAGLPPAP